MLLDEVVHEVALFLPRAPPEAGGRWRCRWRSPYACCSIVWPASCCWRVVATTCPQADRWNDELSSFSRADRRPQAHDRIDGLMLPFSVIAFMRGSYDPVYSSSPVPQAPNRTRF
jgi:hypothetical protein